MGVESTMVGSNIFKHFSLKLLLLKVCVAHTVILFVKIGFSRKNYDKFRE